MVLFLFFPYEISIEPKKNDREDKYKPRIKIFIERQADASGISFRSVHFRPYRSPLHTLCCANSDRRASTDSQPHSILKKQKSSWVVSFTSYLSTPLPLSSAAKTTNHAPFKIFGSWEISGANASGGLASRIGDTTDGAPSALGRMENEKLEIVNWDRTADPIISQKLSAFHANTSLSSIDRAENQRKYRSGSSGISARGYA